MLYPSHIHNLTDSQQKLLALLAYTGDASNSTFLSRAASVLKTTQKALKEDVKVLVRKAFLVQHIDVYYWNRDKEYCIADACHFRVLCWLCDEHPDWLKTFKMESDELATDLLTIAQAWKTGTLDKVKLEYDDLYNEEMFGCVLCVVYDEAEMVPFFRNLSDDLLEGVLQGVKNIVEAGAATVFFRRFLDAVVDGRKKKREAILQKYYDYCRVNEFINDGIYQERAGGEATERGLWMKAVHEAYARHFTEAVLYLEKALKAHNKGVSRYGEEKNVMSGYITNFFMMLIYALDGSVAAKKKLETACRKRSIYEGYTEMPSYILGTYFKDTSMVVRIPVCLLSLSA